jgi:hypothetical protein
MKRYLIFAGDRYYPRLHLGDYAGQSDDAEEAQRQAKSELTESEWSTVLDTVTGDLVLFDKDYGSHMIEQSADNIDED